MDLRITKEDSEAIGFVIACSFAQAISIEDINRWAESVLMAADDYPDYILELCVFNGHLKDLNSVVGFAPVCKLSEAEFSAIHGIADMRGINRFEPAPTKVQAKCALESNAHILQRFREQFSFVQFNA